MLGPTYKPSKSANSRCYNNVAAMCLCDFEVLRSMSVKFSVLWNVSACSVVDWCQCNGRLYLVLPQRRRVNRARKNGSSIWEKHKHLSIGEPVAQRTVEGVKCRGNNIRWVRENLYCIKCKIK